MFCICKWKYKHESNKMVMIYNEIKIRQILCGRKSVHYTLYNCHILNISNEVYVHANTLLNRF